MRLHLYRCIVTIFTPIIFIMIYLITRKEYEPYIHRHSALFGEQLKTLRSKYDVLSPMMVATEILKKNSEFVFVSFLDDGYLDMTLNCYETSIARHNITNVMFVSQSRQVCLYLLDRDITCALYSEDNRNTADDNYGSRQFRKKMNVRAELILDLLNNNVTIFVMDADIYFMKNPIPVIIEDCKGYDICSLRETHEDINAGFVLLRPTTSVIQIMKKRIALTQAYSFNPPTDQGALNIAVTESKTVKLKFLDRNKFQKGASYFQYSGRHFADDVPSCRSCVVVHNNWIVTKVAKIYRFKENMMWNYDGDHYYTSSDRKYITYDNPEVADRTEQLKLEEEALKNALAIGILLDRIVIFPKFHCNNIKQTTCSFISHFNLESFSSIFDWREHMFLKHSKVPEYVKTSQSEPYLIRSQEVNILKNDIPSDVTVKESDDPISDLDILFWFSGLDDVSVLKFHSLYNSFHMFQDPLAQARFDGNIYKAFKNDVYAQSYSRH